VAVGLAVGFPGVAVGLAVGLPGVAVGLAVGLPGVAVGLAVGLPGVAVGLAVGPVGDCVGDAVGVEVGLPVGDPVGEVVGDCVGLFVGESVGEFVGLDVGEKVLSSVLKHTFASVSQGTPVFGAVAFAVTSALYLSSSPQKSIVDSYLKFRVLRALRRNGNLTGGHTVFVSMTEKSPNCPTGIVLISKSTDSTVSTPAPRFETFMLYVTSLRQSCEPSGQV
jgi:hypothetical protein